MRSPAHDRVSVPMAQFLLLGLLAILSRYRCLGFHEETRYPCAFIDTANITDIPGSVGDNATYFYNWTPIPHHLVAVYDFVIDNGIRIPARKHLRACVCRLKPCVRICCPSGHLYDADTRRCSLPRRGLPPLPSHSHMEVELLNGSLRRLELGPAFSIHIDTPCKHMKPVTKGAEYVHWTLHEVGTRARAEVLSDIGNPFLSPERNGQPSGPRLLQALLLHAPAPGQLDLGLAAPGLCSREVPLCAGSAGVDLRHM